MNAKKAILALVVVFLGFWMFTDPNGLADAASAGAGRRGCWPSSCSRRSSTSSAP